MAVESKLRGKGKGSIIFSRHFTWSILSNNNSPSKHVPRQVPDEYITFTDRNVSPGTQALSSSSEGGKEKNTPVLMFLQGDIS